MSALDATIYVATVKSSKLDAGGCIEVEINRVGTYKAVVATMMAGNRRGFVFLPDDGDQVLVAAVAGANVQWAVIGNIWSQNDAAPETNADGKNVTKIIRTRSGNEVRFTDDDGKERIEISSPNGEVTVKAKKITLVGDVRVTDSSNTGGNLVVGGESAPNTTIGPNKITGN